MRMLEQSLSPQSSDAGSTQAAECATTAVVYINTWQLEGYDDAKAAILSAVLLQLQAHERFGAKVRKRTLKLLTRINVMRLTKLAIKYGLLPAAAVAAAATGDATALPGPAALAASQLSQSLVGPDEEGDKTPSTGPTLEDLAGVWRLP